MLRIRRTRRVTLTSDRRVRRLVYCVDFGELEEDTDAPVAEFETLSVAEIEISGRRSGLRGCLERNPAMKRHTIAASRMSRP